MSLPRATKRREGRMTGTRKAGAVWMAGGSQTNVGLGGGEPSCPLKPKEESASHENNPRRADPFMRKGLGGGQEEPRGHRAPRPAKEPPYKILWAEVGRWGLPGRSYGIRLARCCALSRYPGADASTWPVTNEAVGPAISGIFKWQRSAERHHGCATAVAARATA